MFMLSNTCKGCLQSSSLCVLIALRPTGKEYLTRVLLKGCLVSKDLFLLLQAVVSSIAVGTWQYLCNTNCFLALQPLQVYFLLKGKQNFISKSFLSKIFWKIFAGLLAIFSVGRRYAFSYSWMVGSNTKSLPALSMERGVVVSLLSPFCGISVFLRYTSVTFKHYLTCGYLTRTHIVLNSLFKNPYAQGLV